MLTQVSAADLFLFQCVCCIVLRCLKKPTKNRGKKHDTTLGISCFPERKANSQKKLKAKCWPILLAPVWTCPKYICNLHSLSSVLSVGDVCRRDETVEPVLCFHGALPCCRGTPHGREFISVPWEKPLQSTFPAQLCSCSAESSNWPGKGRSCEEMGML